MKTVRGGLMLVAVLLGLGWGPTVGQAAWGQPAPFWKSRQGTFQPQPTDRVKLTAAATWRPYQADGWHRAKQPAVKAKLAVDQRNVYLQVAGQTGQPLLAQGYRLTVNHRQYVLNLTNGVSRHPTRRLQTLQPGQRTFLTVQVVDVRHNWTLRFVKRGAYVQRDRQGRETLRVAVPLAAIGKQGTLASPATSWYFNHPTLNAQQGISYHGAPSGGWLSLVSLGLILGGGWWGRRRKQVGR